MFNGREPGWDGVGGFMKTPDSSQPSSTQQAGKTWSKTRRTVLPVTVSDLVPENFTDDHFCILGQKVYMVSLVALVRSVERQSNRNIYEVDDYTGPWLRVIQWLEDIDESDPDYVDQTMVVNTYVHIYGSMRNMNEETHVVTFNIRPVTNYSEVTNHILKVMKVKKDLMNPANQNKNQQNTSMDLTTSHAPTSANVNSFAGMTAMQQKVYHFIQNYESDVGCPKNAVARDLKVNALELNKIMEFLHSEGHIYSTIDDDHYNATG